MEIWVTPPLSSQTQSTNTGQTERLMYQRSHSEMNVPVPG